VVIPPSGAERFETADLGFDIVGFKVDMHSLLGRLDVVGPLKQYSNLGVW
jgi:hypothetical protein